MQNYFVYVLYSKKVDTYYIGCSNDTLRRLKYHRLGKGGGKRAFTRKANDWKIAWEKEFLDKKEAMIYERSIKKQKSRKVIEKLVQGN